MANSPSTWPERPWRIETYTVKKSDSGFEIDGSGSASLGTDENRYRTV